MTTVAQGIVKTTAFVKQSALGSPGSSGSKLLRRITFVPQADRDTFESNEIVSHQQSTGVAYGLKSVSAKLSGLLSAASYAPFMAAALRADFASGATTGALTNVTAASTSGAQGTLTRAAGSYITNGFKLFDIVRVTGFTSTGATNNSKNMLIVGLTATVMTVLRLDGSAVGNMASGDSVTITVAGKKSVAPLTGHTDDYFTIEDWYDDIDRSELFTDLKVNQIDIGLPATGNATIGIDFLGLGRSIGSSQVCTSPAAATTTSIMTATNGAVYANGSALANVTGLTITINGGMQKGDAVVGSNSANDIARGRIKVTGQFTALFTDAALSALYDAETPISLVGLLLDNPLVGTTDFVKFVMGRIKITSDMPDDGEKTIVRTYSFTAEIDNNGGSSTIYDQSIIAIQDSAA